MKILGYHERDKTIKWKPGSEILKFLEKHNKPVFVTFGSMTNPNPLEKTNLLLEIFRRNNIAAIINTFSGGLVEPENYDRENILFVRSIPYDWIFPKVYAVIHHGGSGTTHMAVRSGCASLIVPHVIDQFCWNDIINQMQLGPKGIKISVIGLKNLEPLILDLMNNETYRSNAQILAEKMQKEKELENELYMEIIA